MRPQQGLEVHGTHEAISPSCAHAVAQAGHERTIEVHLAVSLSADEL